MRFIYWCEFPEKCDWKILSSWLEKEPLTVYIACSSRREYERWKTTIAHHSLSITVHAWPILPKEKGYWFSSFLDPSAFDLLEEFHGLSIKIDVEPPIAKKYSLLSSSLWLCGNIFRSPVSQKEFQEKVKNLAKDTEIILSTFPFPLWVIKRYGWFQDWKLKYNYMYYRTFIPRQFQWLYRLYYRSFVRAHPSSFFAIGLIGPGVFKNEPVYRTVKEFEKDILFFKRLKVDTLVIYSLESLTQRGKEWFDIVQKFSKHPQ